jgi:hypothetical protein
LIDKGLLKTVFVKSENNDADIFTKNVTKELFLTYMEKNVDDSYTEDVAYILFQQHWDDWKEAKHIHNRKDVRMSISN